MTRLRRLTMSQRDHMRTLARDCLEFAVVGVDVAARPVVVRTDVRNTVRYAIRANGSGVDPVEPVLHLDLDEDIAEIDREFIEEFYDPDKF